MSTETVVLPAPPAPAPKRHRIRGGLIAVGIGLALAVAIGSQMNQADTTSAPSSDVVSGTAEPDWARGVELMEQVNAELAYVTPTSLISEDVIHLNQAADLLDENAALFFGTTYVGISSVLESAASHFRAAALAESAGDFDGFNREMNAAADDFDTAVAMVDAP